MISFEQYNLPENIKRELLKLKIEFVFQPIFHKDGKTVYAYEALMRPRNMTIIELIYQYSSRGLLHTLELATIFGASQAHIQRGFTEMICINSFPSESLTSEEIEEFNRHYGDREECAIIEILEYPEIDESLWQHKRRALKNGKLKIALDDYGTGVNNQSAIDFFEPDIIKLDRALISGIDKDPAKQQEVEELIVKLHARNIEVLAEGIETKEECTYLQSVDIDYLQGYYLGMPQ